MLTLAATRNDARVFALLLITYVCMGGAAFAQESKTPLDEQFRITFDEIASDQTFYSRLNDARKTSGVVKIPRSEIIIFRYAGSGGASAVSFEKFIEILKKKFRTLTAEVAFSNKLDQVPQLRIPGVLSSSPSNAKQLEEEWRARKALQIFTGIMDERQGSSWVSSSIYIGPHGKLDPIFAKNNIEVDLHITASEFKRTVDSHTLVTLYAMAIDGIVRQAPLSEVFAYLAHALSVASDLQRRGESGGDVAAVKASIERLSFWLARAPTDEIVIHQ
jgi:hypothetical protein